MQSKYPSFAFTLPPFIFGGVTSWPESSSLTSSFVLVQEGSLFEMKTMILVDELIGPLSLTI